MSGGIDSTVTAMMMHDEEMYQMQALMNQDTTTKPDISKNMNTE